MAVTAEQLASYERALREHARVLRLETTIRTNTPKAQALIPGFRHYVTPGIYQHYEHTAKKSRLYAVWGLLPGLHGNPASVMVRPYKQEMTEAELARCDAHYWLLTGNKGFLMPVKKEYVSKPYAGPRLWQIDKLNQEQIAQLFRSN